jgi:hypothetical protein
MLTLPEFFELIEHRVTGGSEFQWQCYGHHAYVIESDRKANCANYSFSVVFDRDDQVVYEVTVSDYNNRRAYRMINPDFKFGHDDEAAGRNVPANQAWDDILYTDLETVEDFVTKARAIIAGKKYDPRISIPLTLPNSEMLALMTMAHERDMTFNDFVTEILEQALADLKKEVETHGAEAVRSHLGR